MSMGYATVNLRQYKVETPRVGRLMGVLIRLEAWLDRRASRRALYRLDERTLADIGLTEADLGRPEPTAAWRSYAKTGEWR